MNAFITGSRVYGKPNPRSDVDLVVLVDYKDELMLRKKSEGGEDDPTVVFGDLNLVVCTDPVEFSMWKTGTEIMRREKAIHDKPVSKKKAKKILDWLRKKLGMEDSYQNQTIGHSNDDEDIPF